MNIVHLLSQNHLTGAEVYAVTLGHAQLSQNDQVYQISNGFFYPSRCIQKTLPVETSSFFQFLKSVIELRRFLKEKKIDLIHTHSRAAAKLANWATWQLKTATVSTIHGQQHFSYSKKLLNQYGQLMLAVCENIKNHLIQDFNYRPHKIKVIRNPINLQIFKFKDIVNESQSRQKLKIALIGRTTGPKKTRTEKTIEALAEISQKNQFVFEVSIVGGFIKDLELGITSPLLINEVQAKSLTSDDYQKYDLIVGSGRVCVEALISGVPVVAYGEALHIGLIRTENFQSALESNFADIDLSSKGPQINRDLFLKDIQSVLANEIKSNELKNLSLKTQSVFNEELITKSIQRIYESAVFLKKFSKPIPVLMYHKIPLEEIKSKHKIFVKAQDFEKHLRFFSKMGFQTLTFSDLEKFRKNLIPFSEFPKKPLILTFDDGYKDNLDHASPLLKKYNFKAQIFLLANQQINSNSWDHSVTEPAHEILSGPERQKWIGSAFEIGSHGFSHRKMTEMTLEEAEFELIESKKALETEFNIKINVFAFTFGDTNPELSALSEKASYDYAVNTDRGGFFIEESPFEIFRINIFPNENFFSLFKKTSRWYRWYYFKKRKQ